MPSHASQGYCAVHRRAAAPPAPKPACPPTMARPCLTNAIPLSKDHEVKLHSFQNKFPPPTRPRLPAPAPPLTHTPSSACSYQCMCELVCNDRHQVLRGQVHECGRADVGGPDERPVCVGVKHAGQRPRDSAGVTHVVLHGGDVQVHVRGLAGTRPCRTRAGASRGRGWGGQGLGNTCQGLDYRTGYRVHDMPGSRVHDMPGSRAHDMPGSRL